MAKIFPALKALPFASSNRKNYLAISNSINQTTSLTRLIFGPLPGWHTHFLDWVIFLKGSAVMK